MVNYNYICVRCCRINSSSTCPCGGEGMNIGRTQFQVFLSKTVSKARKKYKTTKKRREKILKAISNRRSLYKNGFIEDLVRHLKAGIIKDI